MKIISKFTDFYDHYAYMYGCEPDKSIVYNRNTDATLILRISDKNIQKEINDFYDKHTFDIYNIKYNQDFAFHQCFIGIYPYVYYCAYVYQYKYTNPKTLNVISTNINIIPISIDDIINGTMQDTIDLYAEEYGLDYVPDIHSIIHFSTFKFKTQTNANIKRIIECPEIFHTIGCPVFMFDNINLTKNPIITKDTNLFKCFDMTEIDQNVYSNIEQFLVNQNKNPIVEPDNKTKIINAGFDNKTSFRNM